MSIESALKSVDARCVHYIRLLSLNSFRLWPRSPVVLNVNNLEESMSSDPFKILNTCNMSALYLLN